MDPERARRRQSLKILISESIMVLAVISTVTVLAFIVSGYWLNSNFEVERNGLLQISSYPTGADVQIDGDSAWLQRTNTSKILSSGKHNITLTKEGYGSWSKTINISEGLLYRLHYPRLFLQNRHNESILDTTGTITATISPDHNSLILINDTTEWKIANLDNDKLNPQKLNVSDIFSTVSLAESANIGLFTGKITDIEWDRDSTHVLFKIQSDDKIEWVLLDIKNSENSINLTREFGDRFDKIQILDNNSSSLLAIQNNNLYRIDIPNKTLSAILIESIIDFSPYDSNEIIFSAYNPNQSSDTPYYIGTFKLNNNQSIVIKQTATPAKVTLSKFYDDRYITILEDNTVTLYQQNNPEPLRTFVLSFSPSSLRAGHEGEFITMTLGNQIATIDMEALDITEWQTDSDTFGWLNSDMIFSIANGELIVYDYDGLNRRAIASNVSSHFPATITNNKWLYYFSDDYLIRETISD